MIAWQNLKWIGHASLQNGSSSSYYPIINNCFDKNSRSLFLLFAFPPWSDSQSNKKKPFILSRIASLFALAVLFSLCYTIRFVSASISLSTCLKPSLTSTMNLHDQTDTKNLCIQTGRNAKIKFYSAFSIHLFPLSSILSECCKPIQVHTML